MATQITKLKRAISAAIASCDGLTNSYEQEPAAALFPCAFPLVRVVDHEQTLGANSTRDLGRYDFDLIVAVSKAMPIDLAQEVLDGFMSPIGAASIRAALAADRTLGGLGVVFPRAWGPPDDETIGGIDALGARLPVTVWAIST